jgi:SAM-dependent methyltransferase
MQAKISIRLFSTFFDRVGRNWENAWAQNATPWETGSPSPPLISELKNHTYTPASRALVPGCGSGHDCNFLASCRFSEVIGLDLSSTAISMCNKTFEKEKSMHDKILKFESADYFKYQNGKFNLIFDYLFFSALDPTMREAWANAMANNLLAKDGRLLTLMFPFTEDKLPINNIGPPYIVNIECYKSVLEPKRFKLVNFYKVCIVL